MHYRLAVQGWTNVTEKTALYSEQRREQDFQGRALDQHAIVSVTDVKGNITHANDKFCEISGYTREELIGQNHRMLKSEEHSAEFYNHLWNTIANGKTWHGEINNLTKNGEHYWVEATIVPFLNDNGKPFRYVAIRTDVTDRKLIERRLRVSNADLEQFAYVASHDLKAPLRGIENLVEWLSADLEGKLDDKDQRYMDLLRGRTARMESLLNGLLAYSRVGQNTEALTTLDTRQLIEDVVDLMGLPDDMTVVIAPDMPTLQTSKVPLELVFRNLIGNAVKHHDCTQGQIIVKSRIHGRYYEFSVEDDGPGIPPEYHERIFGIFQTLKPRDEVEGSGMGLALVKKTVDSQSGKIEIVSDAPHKRGTAVHFTWPRRMET